MKNLLLFGFALLLLLVACKKELRTKTYPLQAYNNSGLTGQVTFLETNSKDSIIVKLEAHGLIPNTVYPTHLHTGTPGNLTGTLVNFPNVQSSTGNVVTEAKWLSSFDEAINSGTCFTLHNPVWPSNDTLGYALAGNTGANAQ